MTLSTLTTAALVNRARKALATIAPAAIIALVWAGTVAGTGWACYRMGTAHAELAHATAERDELLAALRDQQITTAQLLKDRERLDSMAKMMDNRTRKLHNWIAETVKREELEAWYNSPANPIERAALYGMPDSAARATVPALPDRRDVDSNHTGSETNR